MAYNNLTTLSRIAEHYSSAAYPLGDLVVIPSATEPSTAPRCLSLVRKSSTLAAMLRPLIREHVEELQANSTHCHKSIIGLTADYFRCDPRSIETALQITARSSD